jgi:hypothetical protein
LRLCSTAKPQAANRFTTAHLSERRDSFMPTRVPSVCRPWGCLAVALCLAVGSTPRAEAKPPDLPQPTDYEFAPQDNGPTRATRMLVPQDLFEEEQTPPDLSPADRCAALRTITRCLLFGLNPLAPLTRADRCLEYDDTPSAPIFHVGDCEVGVGGLLRDAVVALCTGPFSSFSWHGDPLDAPAAPCTPAGEEDQDENVEIVPLHGGAIIEKCLPTEGQEETSEPPPASSMGPCTAPSARDFCPQTHECPTAKMPPPATNGQVEQPQARMAEQYLSLAQFFADAGYFGEACAFYERVCVLCPGTYIAREAMQRMQALCASMSHGAAKPAAGEEQESPSVCPAAEHTEKKAEEKSSDVRSFLNNLEALEKAARLYEEAEALMHEGKVDEACGLYEKIRELCPGHRYADMAADRLQELQGLRTKPAEGVEEGQTPPDMGQVFGAIGDLVDGCWEAFLDGWGGVPPPSDEMQRMEQLLKESEDLRQIEREWSRLWVTDQPSHLSSDCLHDITEAGASADKKTTLEERLGLPVSLNCKDAALPSLLDDLRAWRGINIVVDRKALEDEGISQDVKISLRVEHVSLKSALNLMLRQAGLMWKIQDEVVLITTPRAARPPLTRNIYSISDLVRADRSSGKSKKGPKGDTEAEAAEEIIVLIEDTIAPQSWIGVGGDCALEYFSRGRALVVTQTPEVHEQIADLLATLRRHLKADQQDGSEEASSVEPEARRPLVAAGYDVTDVLATHKLDLNRKTDQPHVMPVAIPSEELIALIRDGVAPESWDVHGGRGTIHYNPELKTLFIEQTPEVHEAIQELLDTRRREIERHKKECEREGAEEPQEELRHGVSEPTCDDPPDDAAVLRALPPLVNGVPEFCEETRDDIRIVKERLVDKIDSPRFFPLLGWARLHHCHYKCTVYYTETCQSAYPFPFKVVRPCVQVVYIDRDRLRLDEHFPPEVRKALLRDRIEEPGGCCCPAASGQLKTPAVDLQPSLPPIDPGIVPAYSEILEKPDQDLACCEEEQEPTTAPIAPGVCFDFDQHKDGALRVRCQLGRFCFHLDCDQQNHGSLLLGLGIDSGNPLSEFFGTALEGVRKAFDSASKPDEKDSSDTK